MNLRTSCLGHPNACNTVLLHTGYSSVAVINHGKVMSRRKSLSELLFQRVRVHDGRAERQQLTANILNCKYEAKRVNWEWFEPLNCQILTPVTYFFQTSKPPKQCHQLGTRYSNQTGHVIY